MVREVRERVAERRELPVDDRADAELVAVEDEVVDAEVAVRDARGLVGRHVPRQPVDELFHGIDALELARAVLLAPALDLARHVVLAAAEIREAGGVGVDRVDRRDHAVHFFVDGGAFGRCQAWQRGVPEDPPFDVLHEIERRARHADVVAITQRARHGYGAARERVEDAELAVDGVRRRQQRARRLAPQHVAAAVRGQ